MFTQLEYYLNIFDGKLDWDGQQKSHLNNELAKVKNGTQAYVRIDRIPHPKTDAQRKAFFGLLLATAIEYFNDNGIDTSKFLIMIARLLLERKTTGNPIRKDFLKEMLYTLCPIYDENGRRKTIQSMSIEEMSQFYEDSDNLLAALGIVIPECDKEWRRKKLNSITDIKLE